MPRNTLVLKAYRKLVKLGKIEKNPKFEKVLRLKKVRTISGVAPVAVLTKPAPCPGECVYCPLEPGIPKSYLSDEPAVERAKGADFDPYTQVSRRVKQYKQTGHSPQKIELIVIGGSFSSLDKEYKTWFVKRCFDAANGTDSPSLKKAQKINETATNRIIGITLETRPDLIDKKEIKLMRNLGGTRVEIGAQSLNNKVLKKVKRGHGVKETKKATRLLKDAGFKVCYHMMPNLPGSSFKNDLKDFEKLFSDPRFKPDMIKIYPTTVLKEAKLYDWFKKGKYQAYSDKKLIKLLSKIKSHLPRWVRVNRVIRDIPADYIVAGTKVSNLRQVVKNKMKKNGLRCKCVRCREIKGKEFRIKNLELRITKYKASKGREYFLEFIDKDEDLYGLLRLRLVKENVLKDVFPVLEKTAIVREVHVFGQAEKIGKKSKKLTQHQGLGEKLLKKAEEISEQQGFSKIAVISGVGAREYYRKFGYSLKDSYMVKSI